VHINKNAIRVKRREIQTLHRSKWFIFSTPAQSRFSFERTIEVKNKYTDREHISSNVRQILIHFLVESKPNNDL
jgi:hypothetical protein